MIVMAKQVKSVLHEPYCNWYLIRYTDGTVKETRRTYKYVEKFMKECVCPVRLTPVRLGYYRSEKFQKRA